MEPMRSPPKVPVLNYQLRATPVMVNKVGAGNPIKPGEDCLIIFRSRQELNDKLFVCVRTNSNVVPWKHNFYIGYRLELEFR